MKISSKDWVIFILIAFLGLGFWYKFEYPRFTFVDLSVSKQEALAKAESYLRSRGIDTTKYFRAIVFDTDEWSDRYLQKTIGIKSEEDFLKQHYYELFFWRVRFFQQLKKEEYEIRISSKNSGILRFVHLIEDIEPREYSEKNIARKEAEDFLTTNCGLNLKDYDFHEEKIKRYDKRIDYSFSWEKKNVYIPWQKQEGKAKLLIGATISGKEIREFYKNKLDIPEKFYRYIENQFGIGEILSNFYFLIFVFLLFSSIYIVSKRKNNLVTRLCKEWFTYLFIFFAIINICYIVNILPNVIFNYSTSISLKSFLIVYFSKIIINLIFLSVAFILPGLAGEALRYEVMPENKFSSFLYYINSTFFSRKVSSDIIFGYILFFILIGFQAMLFYFGQKYLGVWREWIKLTQLTSAHIPFLSAFIIAATVSLNEEIVFRLFSICWAKKYLKNTIIAVILSSLVWGLGHSEYVVFPVWFRVVEVSIVGFLLGFIFINYGIIPLIVAHYLFDVFLGVAAYILGVSSLNLFLTSFLILLVPMIFAAAAYFLNKEDKDEELKLVLHPNEKYNLEILITFVTLRKSQGFSAEQIKKELLEHNWDISLIELAINKVFFKVI